MDNTVLLDIRKNLKEVLTNMDFIKEHVNKMNKKANKILEIVKPQNEILKNDVENLITQIRNLKLETPENKIVKKSIIFIIREE